jgi:hypothetical protein
MFDNFEVTLIRVEGLGNVSNSLCYLSMNDEPVDSIALRELDSSQHTCTIPSKGQVRISIEDQAVLASLRFDINIIKCQGYHWLPLFLDASDLILEVPEEVGLPRILLIFQSRKFLSPVIEITETSEMSETLDVGETIELPTEEISKNVELRMRIMELEQTLQMEKSSQMQAAEKLAREFKMAIDKMNFEVEKYKIWSEKYKKKCEAISEELETRKKAMREVEDERDLLRDELSLYKEKYSELMKSQEELYAQVVAKEKEIGELKKGKEKRNEFEIEAQTAISIEKTVKGGKKQRLINFTTDEKGQGGENCENAGAVHSQLQECLSKLKLDGLFQRSNEQFYKIGCKRVAVVARNGNVYCKIGESYKTLENYIFSHCSAELEAFIKKRANSGPGHRRFHTFSSSFDNTLVQEKKSIHLESEVKVSRTKNKSITPALVRNSKSRIR